MGKFQKNFFIRNFVDIIRSGRWKLEDFQRNAIFRGLKRCQNNDLILISDVDEIPSESGILFVKKNIKKDMVFSFIQKMFYYYLNGYVNDSWIGTKACLFETLRKKFKSKPQDVRLSRLDVAKSKFKLKKSGNFIEEGGWHFSYLGSVEDKIKKILSISHAENDLVAKQSADILKSKIEKGEDLFGRKIKIKYMKINKFFPTYLIENKNKLKKLIKNEK